MVPYYSDDSLSDRLSYLEGVWVRNFFSGKKNFFGRLKPAYNSAETGIGTSHNSPSAFRNFFSRKKNFFSTANRKAAASRDTTFIDCYDYEGVFSHINKGTRLTGTLNGVYYELRVVRKSNDRL